ncbi:hypothetical protein [Kitasatospora sp. NPDC056184]|uniref:hypothetical protein n=1 Tax=Kitasatospora sp. NPDC056184 TaxID=3345738 RepID=UPI0035D85B24
MQEKTRATVRDLPSSCLLASGSERATNASGILKAVQGHRISDVFAGPKTSYALGPDGKLLGRESWSEELTAQARGVRIADIFAGWQHVAARTAEDTLIMAGSHRALPKLMKAAEGRKIVDVAAPITGFAVALTAEGSVLGADREGWDLGRKLAEAARGRQVTAISAGPFGALALTADGTLLTSGNGNYGEIPKVARAAKGRRITAIAACTGGSFAVTEEGAVLADGRDAFVTPALKAMEGRKITAISACEENLLALAADGTLLAASTDDESDVVPGILKAAQGRKILKIAAGVFHNLVLVAPSDEIECPPLQPGQTCLAFTSAERVSLVVKRGTDSITIAAGTAKGWKASETPHQVVVRSTSRDLAVGSVYFATAPDGRVGVNREASQLPAGLTATVPDGTDRVVFHWAPGRKH